MAFTVLRVPEARRTVENELTKRKRRAYDAAVEARGERVAAPAGSGSHRQTRVPTRCASARFYSACRLVTVYLRDGSILIVAVKQHTEAETPSAMLAKSFPGLAVAGR
jgi:plasmid stabilization system protein ParE